MSQSAGGRAARQANPDWWRQAVLYQVYPRSFADASGDGVGDLAGITARLPHIAALGADAVWISPFYPSPMRDFGYDVSDYVGVHRLFGTLDDFDRLVAEAERLNLGVIVDLVLSHTSDAHPWFTESRQDRTNPRADWYVWADAKPDGTPPNNWLSIFGGPAWQWDTSRGQYYLHNFLVSQPDLNVHNPAVVEALMDVARFWLDRGVAGFRLDALNFLTHDPQLRDNPARDPARDLPARSIHPSNPYGRQIHVYDRSRPTTLPVLERLRAVLDDYPGSTTVAEVADDTPHTAASYVAGSERLHMAYSFDLLTDQHSPAYIREIVEETLRIFGDGWPCWALSNHDVTRVATRWSDAAPGTMPPPELARAAMVLLLTLPGTPCIYQGEELGLPEAEIPFERLQDPYGIAFWPKFKGRDGCRTPMPWQHDAVDFGFSTGDPWLPLPGLHADMAVDRLEADPDSLLHLTRTLIRYRRGQPALTSKRVRFLDTDAPILAYERPAEDGDLAHVIALNLSANPAIVELDVGQITAMDLPGFTEPGAGGRLVLPGYGILMGTCPPAG